MVSVQAPPSHFKPGRTSKQHERHYVVHEYHDYANEPDDPAKTPIRRRKGGVNIPFPIVLHRVIARVEEDGYGHIFGWQPHGRAFLIHKAKEFNEFILPKYFKQNKLTSFQRQLNLYGFNRLTRGLDATGYYHQYFLRDREYLAKRMMRQRIKGTKIKGAASPDAEPDFYAMPPVGPTVDSSVAAKAATQRRDPVQSAVSQEPPVVSSDDMSHGSTEEGDESTQELTVCSENPEENNCALIVAAVPSMTDYKPLGRQVSDPSIEDELMDADDPADALLMDLHKMDPLEDFSFGIGQHTSKNVIVQEIKDDEAFHAMEEDAVLCEMLHHVLDDCLPR